MGVSKERNSNHELLRLIAMLMIVTIHANPFIHMFIHSDLKYVISPLNNGICNIGVTLFVLISGYYGIKTDLKKIVSLECKMITFSLVEFALIMMFLRDSMTKADIAEQLIKSLFPFVTRKYWFYSSYVCLLIFGTLIQKMIDSLNKSEFKRLVGTMLVLFSVLPTFLYFEIIPDNGKGVVQMLMIYLLGRYLRRFVSLEDLRKKKAYLIGGVVILWAVNYWSFAHPLKAGGIYHTICKDNSITNVTLAILVFVLFSFISFSSRVVNYGAKHLFAVFALEYNLINIVISKWGCSRYLNGKSFSTFGAPLLHGLCDTRYVSLHFDWNS